jgi:hypothetical protein
VGERSGGSAFDPPGLSNNVQPMLISHGREESLLTLWEGGPLAGDGVLVKEKNRRISRRSMQRSGQKPLEDLTAGHDPL